MKLHGHHMRANPAVNADRHRQAFGRAGRPVTLVR